MFKVIDVTRGTKLDCECLLIGCTIDRDFYIAPKTKEERKEWNRFNYFDAVKGIFRRKDFVKNKDSPFYKAFKKNV